MRFEISATIDVALTCHCPNEVITVVGRNEDARAARLMPPY
jgi:hypothetical protein